MKACPVGTKIQTVVFDRQLWSPAEAREWLHKHGMKASKKESSGMILSYRFGQAPLGTFDKKSFRTIELDAANGIKAIVGCPRRQMNPCSKIKNPKKPAKTAARKARKARKARPSRAATSAISASSRKAAPRKAPPRLPPVLVYLGRAVELHNDEWGFRWTRSAAMGLYTCHLGKCLYVLKGAKPIAGAQLRKAIERSREKVAQAAKTFEDFHDRDAIKGSIIAAPTKPLVTLGRAHAIAYVSDKWTGSDREYVHEFKTPPLVRADHARSPALIEITGAKLRVKREGITG